MQGAACERSRQLHRTAPYVMSHGRNENDHVSRREMAAINDSHVGSNHNNTPSSEPPSPCSPFETWRKETSWDGRTTSALPWPRIQAVDSSSNKSRRRGFCFWMTTWRAYCLVRRKSVFPPLMDYSLSDNVYSPLIELVKTPGRRKIVAKKPKPASKLGTPIVFSLVRHPYLTHLQLGLTPEIGPLDRRERPSFSDTLQHSSID